MIKKLAIVRKQVSEWNDHLGNEDTNLYDFGIVEKKESLRKIQSIKGLAKANSVRSGRN